MSKQLHIYAHGIIAFEPSDSWSAEFGIVRSIDIINQLKDFEGDEIVMHINSPGGHVNEGFAIYDALVNSGKKITTEIQGLCGSIATVVALAGSTRLMWKNSEFFIHNPWNFGAGDADDFERMAQELRNAEDKIVNFYVEKTGGDADQIRQMMKDETTMQSDQALEMKFVTEIVQPAQAFKSKMSIIQNKMSKNNSAATAAPKAEHENVLLKAIQNLTHTISNWGKPAIKNLDVKLADEKGTLVVDTEGTEAKVGDSATVDGAAAEGTYTTEDGKTIVCEGGKITSITDPTEDKKNEEVENLKLEIAALKGKVSSLETENASALKQVQDAAATLETVKRSITSNYVPPADTTVKNSATGETKDRVKARKESAK